MTFEEAKALLHDGYAGADVPVEDNGSDQLVVRFGNESIPILREEIEQFGANRDALLEASVAPVECSYCSPSVREQLIRPVDIMRSRLLAPIGGRDFTFRPVGSETPLVRVGAASDLFVDFFRFERHYLECAGGASDKPFLGFGNRERRHFVASFIALRPFKY